MISFKSFLSENVDKMKAELAKLNPAQRATLKKLFSGRTATQLHVDEKISKVTVSFGRSVHWVILGPKGGIISHENGANY